MSFPPRIALATKNLGKIKEIMAICRDWPVEWVVTSPDQSGSSPPFPDVAETGVTYLENARMKAFAAAEALEMPAIADDSGIEVDALGAPRALARPGSPGRMPRTGRTWTCW